MPCGGRTSSIGPLAEACLGQMLRGGRSCPSETKLGEGADKAGKDVIATPWGTGTEGKLLASGVTEHKSQQRLHLSELSEASPRAS